MVTLTKADIVKEIAQQNEGVLTRFQVISFVDAFFEEISNALANGEEVKLSGFGRFSLREKKPRMGRNPRTGQAALITARRVVTFHSGPILKQATAKIKRTKR